MSTAKHVGVNLKGRLMKFIILAVILIAGLVIFMRLLALEERQSSLEAEVYEMSKDACENAPGGEQCLWRPSFTNITLAEPDVVTEEEHAKRDDARIITNTEESELDEDLAVGIEEVEHDSRQFETDDETEHPPPDIEILESQVVSPAAHVEPSDTTVVQSSVISTPQKARRQPLRTSDGQPPPTRRKKVTESQK